MTNNPEYVDLRRLRPGPIRHESLPDDVLSVIRSIYDIVGPYLDTTLEQFEIGFMRDADPESEVLLWSCIASAWVDYHQKHLGGQALPEDEEKKLLAALLVISTGVEDVEKLGVPKEVGEKLLACYDELREGQ